MSETQDYSHEISMPLVLADRLRNLALHQMKDFPMTSDQMETWINNCTIIIRDLERQDNTLTISADPQWLFMGLIGPRIAGSEHPQLYRLVYQKGPIEDTVPILQVDNLSQGFWHLRGIAASKAMRIIGTQMAATTPAIGPKS